MRSSAEMQLKIYCDTDTLPHNIRDEKSQAELAALRKLAGYPKFRSGVVFREVMNTIDKGRRGNLLHDYNALEPIPKDERVHGFHTQPDQHGGFVSYPLVSDVQNEVLCEELVRRGLKQRDAEHITQAVCNGFDVFLTRDVRTIIKRHRTWLEARFPTLKIRLPSELLEEFSLP